MSFTWAKFVVALLVLASGSDAFADVVTVPNAAPGTLYRLVFVTSGTRDAQSSNVSDYNAFALAQANLSPQLAALNTTWTAIGSTVVGSITFNARDNTFSNPNTAAGVAFYQLDGLLIANNNADLWDGTLAASISRDQLGGFHGNTSPVWTGTHHSGVASVNPLGGSASPFAQFGLPAQVGSGWVNTGSSNISDGVADFNSMYAISGVLTIAVPEPSSLFLAGVGLFGLLRSRLRRTRA